MGKFSNKRKSGGMPAGLVHFVHQGGITVSSKKGFDPALARLVVNAIRHFINDQVEEGAALVREVELHGFDFLDFTMASSTNPHLGDADPLTWAWGADSKSALLWLTRVCLMRGRVDNGFLTQLPFQLELTEEGSPRHRLGEEVFELLAVYLAGEGLEEGFANLLDVNLPRAGAIFKRVLARICAANEHDVLMKTIQPDEQCPGPLQSSGTPRI